MGDERETETETDSAVKLGKSRHGGIWDKLKGNIIKIYFEKES